MGILREAERGVSTDVQPRRICHDDNEFHKQRNTVNLTFYVPRILKKVGISRHTIGQRELFPVARIKLGQISRKWAKLQVSWKS